MAVLNDNHKSCPFCGGSGVLKRAFHGAVRNYIKPYYVKCQECGSSTNGYISPAMAWNAWDRRAEEKNKAGGAGTPKALSAN